MAQSVRKKFILSLYLYYLYLRHLKYPEINWQLLRQASRSYPRITVSQLPRDMIWSKKDWKQQSEAMKKQCRVFLKLRKTVKYTSSSQETTTGKASHPQSPQFCFVLFFHSHHPALLSWEPQQSLCRKEHQNQAWKSNPETQALALPSTKYLLSLGPSFLSYKTGLTFIWLEKILRFSQLMLQLTEAFRR